jgi:hypothetical protein
VTTCTHQRLRSALLAASVLYDIDLLPTNAGVRLPGVPDIDVSWAALDAATNDVEDRDGAMARQLAGWLRARRWLAAREFRLSGRIRVLGLPTGHCLHPGPSWAVERIPGRAVELGIGLADPDPEAVDAILPTHPSVWTAAGLDPTPWWSQARACLEERAELALQRWHRRPERPLTPIVDSDVVSLLGAGALRRGLAAAHGGLCPAVVPMRSRGWVRLSCVDPAFAPAAAMATAPEQRGFARPLLLTADDVALARDGHYATAATVAGLLPAGDAR